jgi:hypothetical protein
VLCVSVIVNGVSFQPYAVLRHLLQDYTITMYLNQYWKDERLAFSTDDEILTLSGDFAEKIWVPDTFFANDKNRLSTGVCWVFCFTLNYNLLQNTYY